MQADYFDWIVHVDHNEHGRLHVRFLGLGYPGMRPPEALPPVTCGTRLPVHQQQRLAGFSISSTRFPF